MDAVGRWAVWALGLMIIVSISGCLAPEEDLEGDDPDVTTNEEPMAQELREPNPAVSGSNWGCLDYLGVWELPIHSPLAEVFTVEAGTGWTATGSETSVHVEFFDDAGGWIDHGDDRGVVPTGATVGIACAVAGDLVPPPMGEWTFQDGF